MIDATSLAGNLVLNASGIVDTAVGGRQVQIDTGSGHSIISDNAYTETLSLTIGSGNSIVNIASGAEQITISGLKPTDQFNVGSVGVVDLFTNGLGPLIPHQSAIDASATLEDAAALAASFANPMPRTKRYYSHTEETPTCSWTPLVPMSSIPRRTQ